MFNPSREQVRQFMIESWRKRRERLPATSMETLAADIIALHPEYHSLLETTGAGLDAALARDWAPDGGDTNPFLHLSLHLSIEEQLSIDQPPGIVAAFSRLLARHGDRHAALHVVLDSLAETLWQSQRNRAPLDADAYLALLERAATH